jgi:fibronectin-binding autotransporter adhesin
MSGTTLDGNVATTSGAGIYNDAAGTVTASNDVVSGNTATSDGAGVANLGQMTLDTSLLTGNTAAQGGGISNSGVATISNTTISNNATAIGGGGGVLNYLGSLNIVSCTIAGNSASNSAATGYGGGILNVGGTMTVRGSSTVKGNVAFGGGGIATGPGTLTISTSLISGNTANGSDGGGILNGNTGTLVIDKTVVEFNSAVGSGGGIGNFGAALTLSGSTLNGNVAPYVGGLYNDASASAHVSNCLLTANRATGSTYSLAGAVYNSGNLTIDSGSQIVGNISDRDGAGLFNTGYAHVVGSTFSGNFAQIAGGAIANEGTLDGWNDQFLSNTVNGGAAAIWNYLGTINMSSCLFNGNSGYAVGAIYNDQTGTITLDQCTFSFNFATGYNSGAINNSGYLEVDNSSFIGNTAPAGGAISRFGGPVVLQKSTFSANFASYGGAIIITAGSVTLTGCLVSENDAGDVGGGIFVYSGASLILNSSTISGNSAPLDPDIHYE